MWPREGLWALSLDGHTLTLVYGWPMAILGSGLWILGFWGSGIQGSLGILGFWDSGIFYGRFSGLYGLQPLVVSEHSHVRVFLTLVIRALKGPSGLESIKSATLAMTFGSIL